MSKFAVNKNNCVSLIFRSPEARRMRNDGDVLELARGGDISLQKRAAAGLA